MCKKYIGQIKCIIKEVANGGSLIHVRCSMAYFCLCQNNKKDMCLQCDHNLSESNINCLNKHDHLILSGGWYVGVLLTNKVWVLLLVKQWRGVDLDLQMGLPLCTCTIAHKQLVHLTPQYQLSILNLCLWPVSCNQHWQTSWQFGIGSCQQF